MGNVGLIEKGPAGLDVARPSRWHLESKNLDACPAKSSAMLFATRGR